MRQSTSVIRVRQFVHGTTAGPIVEFAIIAPVLMLLLFGVVGLAAGYFQQNSLVSAAREGARFAAVHKTPWTTQARDSAKLRARSSFVKFPGSATLTDAMIDVTADSTTPITSFSLNAPPKVIRVTIKNYPVSFIFNPKSFGQNAFNIGAKASYGGSASDASATTSSHSTRIV